MNRASLLEYLQRAVKLVIVDFVSGGGHMITDANINVSMLCDALTRIFSFALKKPMFSRSAPSLWSVFQSIDATLVDTETLSFIKQEFHDDNERALAWLRWFVALFSHCVYLHSFVFAFCLH